MSGHSEVGIVILAAGESKRLGQPKQLLPFRDGTVLSHVVKSALASKAVVTIVVVGAHVDKLKQELTGFEVTIAENANWQEGIQTSIRHGIETLEQCHGQVQAALILTSDQPHVSTKLIDEVIDAYDRQSGRIVACEYEGTVGVPALFDRSYFPELKSLPRESGAKKVIVSHREQTATVSFPAGGIDIDSTADLKNL